MVVRFHDQGSSVSRAVARGSNQAAGKRGLNTGKKLLIYEGQSDISQKEVTMGPRLVQGGVKFRF